MIAPVAARLRNLLQEDPSRARCSLLITGHSAGGAIAALLYSHMLATSPEAESELNILTGCFKRIHCVSFGAPPVSLLPLERPSNPLLRKSIFLSFVNEGDPVARADKPYIRSLLSLYTAPAPGQSCLASATSQKLLQPLASGFGKSSSSLTVDKVRPGKSSSSLTVNKIRPDLKKSLTDPSQAVALWPVPEATLSNAGRIVLLRSVERYETRPNKKKQIHDRMNEGVVAQIISDELLRGVVWGDPVCHMMRLYKRRIEILATNAVMGRS
jgi:Lipase (class 3)